MSLNTTPRTWVASEIVDATEMNTEIRDAFTGLQAAWSTYTPTTAGLTLGNGTLAGRWNRTGKTIDFLVQFTFGSTSAVTAGVTFTLPTTANLINWAVPGVAWDTSANLFYPATGICTSTTVVSFRVWPTTAGNQVAVISSTVPFTWATGDVMTVAGRFEAA